MKAFIKKYKELPPQLKVSFWFLVCSFLQRGISMITVPIFTRLFSTAEYGRFNVFNSWLGVLTPFVSLNLSYGVYMQGLIKFEDESKIYTSSLQGLTFSLAALWSVAYLAFQSFWNRLLTLNATQCLSMLAIIWTSASFNFWVTEQRVLYRYRLLMFMTLAVSVANPLAGILAVIYAKDKVTARILSMALVQLAAFSGFFVFHLWRGKKFFHFRFWKYSLSLNLPLIPHYLSMTVLNSADKIMIGKMIGESEVGLYSLAYSVSSIMTIFNSAVQQSIGPWIYQNIKKNKAQDIAPVAYMTLIFIAAVNLALILFAPEVVAIFAPAPYYEAIWVIPPVVMSVYFIFSYNLFADFAFYYEKTSMIMAVSVVGAALNVLLNWIFIGLYGYVAAGYTTLICYIVFAISHYALMKHICAVYCDGVMPYDGRIIVKITTLFLLTGFAFLFTYHHKALRYGIILALFVTALLQRRKLIGMVRYILTLRQTSDS